MGDAVIRRNRTKWRAQLVRSAIRAFFALETSKNVENRMGRRAAAR
jgi:hypothetical protein